MSDKSTDAYWKANVRIITICMVIWALVSFGFGIVLRPLLAGIPIGGTDLGFWFAQQGGNADLHRAGLLLPLVHEQTRSRVWRGRIRAAETWINL